MREAYRKKGWAFNDAESIEQCKREGWSEKMQAQKNEGCRAYGYLEVNKVSITLYQGFFVVVFNQGRKSIGSTEIAKGEELVIRFLHPVNHTGSPQDDLREVIAQLSFASRHPSMLFWSQCIALVLEMDMIISADVGAPVV